MQHNKSERASTRVPIWSWKGILAGQLRSTRRLIAIFLAVLATSLTFVQFGFVGIGAEGDYSCYVMALLVPVALAALCFGRGWGFVMGLYAGVVLYVHSLIQPLDMFERYFISPLTSIVFYAVMGFLLNLLFSLALRHNPKGVRRYVYVAIICLTVSVIATYAFIIGTILVVISQNLDLIVTSGSEDDLGIPRDYMLAFDSAGSVGMQVLMDWLLMAVACSVADHIVGRLKTSPGAYGVRRIFNVNLLMVVCIAFLASIAVSFVTVTSQALVNASNVMMHETSYVKSQLENRVERTDQVIGVLDKYAMTKADRLAIIDGMALDKVLEGYGLEYNGTILVMTSDNLVLTSNNEALATGSSLTDVFGRSTIDLIRSQADTNHMVQLLYSDEAYGEGSSYGEGTTEIGYARASHSETLDYYVIAISPSTEVFWTRSTTILWTSLIAVVLLAVVYALADVLLNRLVVKSINDANGSLARITSGQLEEHVDVRASSEFVSLSDGINATVDTLKNHIAESQKRMERDLATAKAIQTSALPRTFPPFPEIDAFDIYASMNAAKEVGGDFYDFFLIDDHTVGFLIADVSGKGIPGALFMMTAKTEIENYLSTGMGVQKAIASANARLCANNDAGMFVTVWAATLDWKTGLLEYVNAGHNPPLLRHGKNGSWEWLRKKGGLFLGTFATAKYRSASLMLEDGDELLLYTDGVNEAFNVNEEEYGNDRLEAFLGEHADLGPKDMVLALRAAVARWAEGAEQSDDVTILSLEYGMSPEAKGSIVVPAVIGNLDQALNLVETELDHRLCPSDVSNRVQIALEELFTNVCQHAYANREEPGEVQVKYVYTTNPRGITVELVDQGVAFDPVSYETPATTEDLESVDLDHMGLLIAKRSVDDMSYVHYEGSNYVVFVKRW